MGGPLVAMVVTLSLRGKVKFYVPPRRELKVTTSNWARFLTALPSVWPHLPIR